MANELTVLERDGERLAIVGIEDPLMGRTTEDMLDIATAYLPDDMFKLLLAHRPEMFNTYVNYHVNLVFSGHAHGGQVRIPGLGGLVAPGQGFSQNIQLVSTKQARRKW